MTDDITTPTVQGAVDAYEVRTEQRRQRGFTRNMAIPVESGAQLHFKNTMDEFRYFRDKARREADAMADADYPIVRNRQMQLIVLSEEGCMDMRDEFDGTAKDMIRCRNYLLEEMQDAPGKFAGKVEIWIDQGFDLCSSIQMGDNYDYIPGVTFVEDARPVWDSTNGWAHKKGATL